jgi:glutaminyl-tRNA synthetase
VAKFNSTVDIGRLEYSLRDDLNRRAPRVMAVLDPVKVVITNYPEGQSEELRPSTIPRTRPPGRGRCPSVANYTSSEPISWRIRRASSSASARGARCGCATPTSSPAPISIKDADGNVTEIHCTYDPATRGGDAPDGRKVKGTLHWVSAAHAVDAEVRLYDRLFNVENPNKVEAGQDWKDHLNPDSLSVVPAAKLEPNWRAAADRAEWSDHTPRVQFERTGYFALDPDTDTAGHPVFNRTVTLRDSWAKIAKK